MLALAARGWPLRGLDRDTALSAYLARPDQRSYDLADLTAALPQARAAGRRDDGRRPAQLRLGRRRRPRRRDRDAAGPRGARPRRRARRRARRTGAAPRLLADVELPLVDVLAEMEQTGIAVDTDRLEELEARVRRPRCSDAADEAYAVDRQGDQPRLAQAAAGGALRRARHAEDQAHQDRLHHRRRRAAGALREDRAPVPAAPAARTATPSGCGRPSRACSRPCADDGRIHTTFNQTDRRHRPAVVAPTPTCRTSRSAPRRAAGSARRSWSARATSRC